MSTSNSSSSVDFVVQQLIIYLGLFLFIAGLIGGALILLVFLTLRTFRQSSCAFYLTIMSFFNILQMFTGVLTLIMISGFGINWTNMSLFYCKIRIFSIQSCIFTSYTCMSLAIIDQFLATCSNPRWHRYNNIKLARFIVTGVMIFWILHGIPHLFYYNHVLSPSTGQIICVITNTVFQKYQNIGVYSVLNIVLPATIMFFGILAYRNVQQIAYRTVPLVRRELDKQLTRMVLVQVCFDVLVVTPYIISTICSLVIDTSHDLSTSALLSLISKLTGLLYYFYFVSPFYIYMCVSTRFRQQLIYVLFTVHFNRQLHPEINNNQVEPQS